MADAGDFEEVTRRCVAAIQSRFPAGDRRCAFHYLNSELGLIQQNDFTWVLKKAVTVAEELKDRRINFRLISSGCASLVNYLLGLTDVDPTRFQLPYQRFWATSSGEAPTYMFVADSKDEKLAGQSPGLIIHTMTPLEALPHRLTEVDTPDFDQATYTRISEGDTDGVFQFDNDAARDIANRFRPTTVRDLATVTALVLRDCSDPELADEFLEHRNRKQAGNDTSAPEASAPILFQEELMAVLHQKTAFSWADAYRFVKEANRNGGLGVNHSLYKQAVQRACSGWHNVEQAQRLVKKLERESQSADCLAHHISNAVTTYRAAFLKTHFPERFKGLLEETTLEA